MNTVGSYVCGCLAGYQLASDGSNKCIPNPCQNRTIKGALECSGKVGHVCNISTQALEGHVCRGILTCDSSTLNFVGNASCTALPCKPHRVPNAHNTCTGKQGDECSLACAHGFKETGMPRCHNQQWTNETCKAVSFSACQTLGLTVQDGVCGDAEGRLGCPHGMTFQQADEYCRGEGARLCSIQEIQSGIISENGQGSCTSHNKLRIWSQSYCRKGHVLTQAGAPDLANYEYAPVDCVPTNDTVAAAVKCCADEVPATVVDVCTSAHSNGFCADQCYVDSENPKGYFCACEKPYHVLAEDGRDCNVECPSGMSATPGNVAPYCVPRRGDKGHRYFTFGSDKRIPFQVGKYNWSSNVQDACHIVPFITPFPSSSTPHVLITASRDSVDLRTLAHSARPFVSWVERINSTGFRVCVQDSSHKESGSDLYIPKLVINWMAYEDTVAMPPARMGEVSLSQFSGQFTQWTEVPLLPKYQEWDVDRMHVQITVNHRHGGVSDRTGVKGEKWRHNGMTSWVERHTETGFRVGVEELEQYKRSWDHGKDANVDYLVFSPWSSMHEEGIHAGVTDMSDAKPLKDKEVVNKQMVGSMALVEFETSAQDGLCKYTPFSDRVGAKLSSVPVVLVTVDHRGDERSNRHEQFNAQHNGMAVWVEAVTDSGMLVCYKDLSRHRRAHGGAIMVDWMAIVV